MFSSTEHISRTRNLFDTQAAYYSVSVQARMDAGKAATEPNVDALESPIASTIVATRHWFTGDGNYDWLTPVLHHATWRASPAIDSETDAHRWRSAAGSTLETLPATGPQHRRLTWKTS